MEAHVVPPFGAFDAAMAVVVAALFILLVSLLREPTRQRFMAIFVAGAGAAYLNGGLGPWEFAFTGVMSWCAYRGLESYRFIGAAWILHTLWDVAHHFYGHPIVFFAPTSSGQCAICDALIALWFFAGAPGVYDARWARRSPAGGLPPRRGVIDTGRCGRCQRADAERAQALAHERS